jgi:hypothetical protein
LLHAGTTLPPQLTAAPSLNYAPFDRMQSYAPGIPLMGGLPMGAPPSLQAQTSENLASEFAMSALPFTEFYFQTGLTGRPQQQPVGPLALKAAQIMHMASSASASGAQSPALPSASPVPQRSSSHPNQLLSPNSAAAAASPSPPAIPDENGLLPEFLTADERYTFMNFAVMLGHYLTIRSNMSLCPPTLLAQLLERTMDFTQLPNGAIVPDGHVNYSKWMSFLKRFGPIEECYKKARAVCTT